MFLVTLLRSSTGLRVRPAPPRPAPWGMSSPIDAGHLIPELAEITAGTVRSSRDLVGVDLTPVQQRLDARLGGGGGGGQRGGGRAPEGGAAENGRGGRGC